LEVNAIEERSPRRQDAKTPGADDRAEHDALHSRAEPGDVESPTEPGAENAVDFDRRIDDRASQSVDFFVPALVLASWLSWRLGDLSSFP
jgi:hypothetical protein